MSLDKRDKRLFTFDCVKSVITYIKIDDMLLPYVFTLVKNYLQLK